MSIYIRINEPTIGLTDRTDKLNLGKNGNNIGFNLQLKQRGSANVPFIMKAPDTYRPTRGTPLYIYDIPDGSPAPALDELRSQPTVVSSGSTAALGTGLAIYVIVTAKSTNGANIRVGGPETSATAGIPLEPGQPFTFGKVEGAYYDLSTLYFWGNSGDGIDVIWLTLGSGQWCTFAGIIAEITTRWIGDLNVRTSSLQVASLERCFDSLFVDPVGLFNMTCGEIIRYLLYNVAAGVPVVAGDIADGPTIPSLVLDYTRMSDIFTQLVTTASATGETYSWGCDPRTSSLYFGPVSTTPAPMNIDSDLVLWETLEHSENDADYRNREIVRLAEAAFSPTVFEAVGDGIQTDFTLPAIARRVTLATIGGSGAAQASATGTFTGQPVALENVTIGASLYTFVDFIGQYLVSAGRTGFYPGPNQVLIGADFEATCQNLADCINYEPSTLNITYGFTAGPNTQVTAAASAGVITVVAQSSGTAGNAIALSETASNFSWSGGTLSGGTDPSSSTGLNVGVEGDGSVHDLYYTVGSRDIRTQVAVPNGETLAVTFFRVGFDAIVAQNDAEIASRAALEHGTGKYDHLISDTSNADRSSGIIEAQTALDTWGQTPSQVNFVTDQPGFLPGQAVAITSTNPTGSGTYVDGPYIIQGVSAQFLRALSKKARGELTATEHFRYTLHLSDAPVASYITFYANTVPNV